MMLSDKLLKGGMKKVNYLLSLRVKYILLNTAALANKTVEIMNSPVINPKMPTINIKLNIMSD